jgi:ApbE superfamily uncharacterized protein (UPF0280 family)
VNAPVSARLSCNRLHLQHGPIDLIISADGEAEAVGCAYQAAQSAFPGILPRLVSELAVLRTPIGDAMPGVHGPVARRMAHACWPYRSQFITPMAAVAGSVADEMVMIMCDAAPLRRLIVNNGGDIAIHLGEGESAIAGVVTRPDQPHIAGTIRISCSDPARGVATSGWRGRSQSRGIADAVTVLAHDAAKADAAATMIANTVDADHPAVRRAPARSVKDDSDLGDLEVTVEVGPLPQAIVAEALARGEAQAKTFLASGLICGAVLMLQEQYRVAGSPALLEAMPACS